MGNVHAVARELACAKATAYCAHSFRLSIRALCVPQRSKLTLQPCHELWRMLMVIWLLVHFAEGFRWPGWPWPRGQKVTAFFVWWIIANSTGYTGRNLCGEVECICLLRAPAFAAGPLKPLSHRRQEDKVANDGSAERRTKREHGQVFQKVNPWLPTQL